MAHVCASENVMKVNAQNLCGIHYENGSKPRRFHSPRPAHLSQESYDPIMNMEPTKTQISENQQRAAIHPLLKARPGRTWLLLVPALFALVLTTSGQETSKGDPARKRLTPFKRQVVDSHEQRYGMSCIPMSIEMVLKLLGRAPGTYYELQDAWKEKADGSFSNFDGKTIAGTTFHKQFGMPRGSEFPLEKLFATIDSELKAGRFVIVSLASSQASWHMYVIYDEDADGDFIAVSKLGTKTIEATKIKETIRNMKGTDILTYEPAATN
jgi:hypothetical protein